MISRIGPTLVMSTALALLMLGCERPTEDASSKTSLSKEEAAKYRQVVIKVPGMT